MKNVEIVGNVTSFNRDIFSVMIDDGRVINCRPGSKIRMNSIQIIEGDKVSVKLDSNFTAGIIVRRLSK